MWSNLTAMYLYPQFIKLMFKSIKLRSGLVAMFGYGSHIWKNVKKHGIQCKTKSYKFRF